MMKKYLGSYFILLVFSANVFAAKMGDYIEMWQNINTFKQSATPESKDAIKNLEMMLTTTDQTMAETIVLMIAQAEQNNKQVICLPKNFNLNPNLVIKLMMEGFNNSQLTFLQKKEMPAAMFVIDELHRQFPCDVNKDKKEDVKLPA